MMKKISNYLKRYSISMTLLIFCVAFYQATLLNWAYYKQVLAVININSLYDWFFLISMPILVFLIIYIFLTILIFKSLIKTAAIIFVLVGSVLMYFMVTFGNLIDRDMLQNALRTNQAESSALITPTLLLYFFVLGVVPTILILGVKIKPIKGWRYYFLYRLCPIIIALIIIAFIWLLFFKSYAPFMRNNKSIIKYLLPSNYIAAVYSQYNFLNEQNIPFVTLGNDAYKKLPVNSASAKKNVIILVLGETARAQNFSLGGYDKQTNPRLSQQEEVIYFQNVTACGTSTAYSVPCMFSNMPRSEYNAARASKQSNVLDILQRADVAIQWRENDGGCQGVCERVPNVTVTELNLPEFCKGGTCYDDILFENLDAKIKQLDNDTLIVLHTMGSHGPTYYLRYPPEQKAFEPTCDTNQINNCTQEALLNTYDNTIYYTDYIVNRTIDLMQQYSQQFNTSVMYLSDHGESLGEKGIYLHSLPYAIAPKEQTDIPMLMWFSQGYQVQQSLDKACLLKQAQQQKFSHDNLFHTLLGAFNIQTKEYQPSLDILQSCRNNQNSE